MRRKLLTAAVLFAAFAQPAWAQLEPASADAPPETPAAAPALDPSALLAALRMTANEQGLVENLCGEGVAPQILPIHVGGAVGTAQLVIISGGPNTAACYGDVPGDMFLLMQDGEGWRTIFTGGGFINVLPETHDGVHDFALGGPSAEHPVFEWHGKDYVVSHRTIDDAQYAQTPSIP
jgi:hypothetical protein